jgi:hypothetical protein
VTYENTPTTTTFQGTGFAAMRPYCFAPYFAFENYSGSPWTRTTMAIDISPLAGATVSHATLSYVLAYGTAGPATMVLTSYSSTGTLAYSFPDPPNVISAQMYTSIGMQQNVLDVTSQVAERVDGGANWLGLYFTMVSPTAQQWTPAYFAYPGAFDGAQVRLTVDYGYPPPPPPPPQSIPEPVGLVIWSLLATGGLGIGWRRRKPAA